MALRPSRWIVQSVLGVALAIAVGAVLDLGLGPRLAAQAPPAGTTECGPGFTGTPEQGCKDINECRVNNGECDQQTLCTNTAGSRTCGGCPPDFKGDGYVGCKDANECEFAGCDFTDRKAPAIRTSGDLTTAASSAEGATVTFAVTAVDNVDGPRPVVCTPASGSVFKVGTTTVTCTSADQRGNKRETTFIVTVKAAAAKPND
jgi:hypothetical protein